jgi:hypothetical protein
LTPAIVRACAQTSATVAGSVDVIEKSKDVRTGISELSPGLHCSPQGKTSMAASHTDDAMTLGD